MPGGACTRTTASPRAARCAPACGPSTSRPCAPEAAAFSGSVEMVEQLGADSLLHIAHGGGTVIVRVPQGMHPAIGTVLHVAADPAHVHLFDAGTGARIA